MTLFGITIPLWILVALLVAAFLFRNELRNLLASLLDKLLPKPKPVIDESAARQLVLQALAQQGLKVGDLENLDGQKLINVLKAFVAFATALAQVTPNHVDDAVVRAAGALVSFLESNPDLANTIAGVLNRLFKA